MTDIAIDVRNVWKTFRLYDNPITGPLKGLLMPWRRDQYSQAFHAVRDVSLQVRRGEVVGIIGENGAGKTTLLKAISGLLQVDRGTIAINGRLATLLAMGLGINNELSGRDNILLNGLLCGMSREDIAAKTHAIVEFAELGDFIDQPFRTYSTGMRARLLFSISMAIDSDILIVDEALATGDAYFVDKSLDRIKEVCRSGATVLFVSHNITHVRQLCDRAVLMAQGRIIAEGRPDTVAAAYSDLIFAREKQTVQPPASTATDNRGDGSIRMIACRVLDQNDNPVTGIKTFEALTLEFDMKAADERAGAEVQIFVGFVSKPTGAYVGGVTSSFFHDSTSGMVAKRFFRVPKGLFNVRVELNPLLLMTGKYAVWLEVATKDRVVYADYREVAEIYVALPGTTAVTECYFTHPAAIKVLEMIDVPAIEAATERT